MDVCYPVVVFLVESDRLDVVEDAEQVSLDGVRVRGLPQDLQEGGVRDKEESREDETFLFQVAREGLLAEFQLLQQVREQLPQSLVPHTALHHIGVLVGLGQDLHPRLVDVLETLGFLECRRMSLHDHIGGGGSGSP